ncbi:DUF1127 domain-containing protein [Amphritea sp. ZJ14W]|uniref:DUF1127 domain-containing protein n=1 Tax=Amphritea pacifica TaxID=2811233 RepID=A0ABS2W694_9GAMM|nr:DUF1127 domain-containing protein [Amphritea pacifica]MBN0987234.1 DUF1127 domain-containing protein [Amphritea pacifica]MBN1005724.1 DUF1127 domain-containing protein [Amphritea pacifica]
MKPIVSNQIDVKRDSKEILDYLAVWQRWLQRYRSRRLLLRLDREQLKDIGVTREEALEEAGKPFWR